MDTIRDGEVFANIRIAIEEYADEAQVNASAELILEEIKVEMLGENMTPEILNEYRNKIGERLKDIPGVAEVKMTPLVTSNAPTIRMGMQVDLKTGTVTVTNEEVIEGKPVPLPPWADRQE